jgi:flagellin
MISVLTNTTSLVSQTNLNRNNSALATSLSKLSSGLRVRSAADDAAGLGISESFKARIRSLTQAKRNANDGVSLIQTAEGSLNETHAMLNRMRELAIQARNGTVNSTQRSYINNEFQQLKSEIDRVSNTAEFNGLNILNGDQAGGIEFQIGVGTSVNDRLTVSIATSSSAALGLTAASALSTVTSTDTAISLLDAAINQVSTRRSTLGAMQNRLAVTVSNLDTYTTNLSAANSRIVDVDVARETSELTKRQVLTQAGASMLAQANQAPQIALSLIG